MSELRVAGRDDSALSEAPKPKHPWAKFHAKPRPENPPAAPALRQAPAFRALPVRPAPTSPFITPPADHPVEPPVVPLPNSPPEPLAATAPAQTEVKRAPRRGPKPATNASTKVGKKSAAGASGADAWVPPVAKSADAAGGGKPTPAARGGARASGVSDELASALKALAAEYAPLPLTNSPFVSVKQREAEARERRRLWRVRLGKFGAGLVVGLGLLYFLASLVLFRYPTEEALTVEVAKTAQAVVLRYTRGERPLEIAGAVPVFRQKIGARHVRYYAEVTLRLRQPLFGAGVSNGTVSYRQLQESLQWAKAQELKFNFFALTGGPTAPELPRLIQEIHHRGEPMVVRVPFEAEQFGWRWRIKPPQFTYVAVDREFSGVTLEYFDATPYLIFGLPETMPIVRERMKAAKNFITAIAKEIQRHADVEAVAEKSPVEDRPAVDAPPGAATGSILPPNPDKPAVVPATEPTPDQPPKPLR